MEENFKEIYKVLHLIYRRRIVFLLTAILFMTSAIVFVYHMPKKYRADSTVFIEENVIKQLVKGLAISPEIDSRIHTLKYAMLSREFLARVLKHVDVDLGIRNEAEFNEFILDLQRRTDVEIRGDNYRKDLFRVSIVDENPYFAEKYINTLVGTFVEENIFSKREETYGANRFIDEQLALFKRKLDNAENEIIEFRKKQGIYSNNDEQVILSDISNYQHSIEELELAIDTLSARRKRFENQIKGIEPTIALFSEKQAESRVAQLQQRISQLLVTYTEDYPEVVKLKSEIDALQSSPQEVENVGGSKTMTVNPLHQDLQQKIFNVEAEISSQVARRNKLKQLQREKELELQNTPEANKKLSVLTQERDSFKKIYEELLVRAGQSELSKQMEIGDKTTTFRIVDPAILPDEPVSPDMVRMIVLAILGGIASGVGLVFLLEFLKSSVRDVSQLTELGLGILSVIPHIPNEEHRKKIRRRDVWAYLLSGLFFSGILGLLGFEFLKKIGKI